MSCYGWERGEVKLPVSEYKTVRDEIFMMYNNKLNLTYKIALSIYEDTKREKKGKRGFNVRQYVQDQAWTRLQDSDSNRYKSEFHFVMLICDAVCTRENKLKKPKKKDFAPLPKSRGGSLYDSDLTLTFDNKTKTIEYYTDDNNHSADAAREGNLGKAFFKALKWVNWTSKTGGYLREFNEYMADEGEGAHVTTVWGKYEKPKHFKALLR